MERISYFEKSETKTFNTNNVLKYIIKNSKTFNAGYVEYSDVLKKTKNNNIP